MYFLHSNSVNAPPKATVFENEIEMMKTIWMGAIKVRSNVCSRAQ